ncbi:RNA polymerase sigma factor [Dactylosporangium siamense]|uniref:DNA-directed RNA polymerase sigma-70 factor n=1 Tax=Dactylosporangium siamense TaxID=685454 RepID=A0A919PKL7_9ACTN|nr:RNA polymerase sigma factor [Dactylosporangium siamense]GIG45689.1 DNA-directed RNA polymerase sigma-70 factor [Dactylosporangium siamense]
MAVPIALERASGPRPADNELIRHSLDDPDAFGGIFDRHAPAIHGYLARRVGHSVADDLNAETFLVAFRRRARYDLAQPDARPWLFGIATNLVHRQRRTELRHYRALARVGVDPIDDQDERVVARAAATAAHRRIAAVLARLSTGERDVLLLLAWQDLGYADIAAALDIPIGTVRSRLNSARKRLRHALIDLSENGSFHE